MQREFRLLIGKQVELLMVNSMENTIKRNGKLEHDNGWYYIYDEGKSGNDFNCAFQENEIHKIVYLKEV